MEKNTNKDIITFAEDEVALYASLEDYYNKRSAGVARRGRMAVLKSAIALVTNDKGEYIIHLNNGYVIAALNDDSYIEVDIVLDGPLADFCC